MAFGDPPATRQQMYQAMDRWVEGSKNTLDEAEDELKKVQENLRSWLTPDTSAIHVVELAKTEAKIEGAVRRCREAAIGAASKVKALRNLEDKILSESFHKRPKLPDDEAIAKIAIEVASLASDVVSHSTEMNEALDRYFELVKTYR